MSAIGPINRVRPIPAPIRDYMDADLDKIENVDDRWIIRRMVEWAYGQGYEDGYRGGRSEERTDAAARREQAEKLAGETEGATT